MTVLKIFNTRLVLKTNLYYRETLSISQQVFNTVLSSQKAASFTSKNKTNSYSMKIHHKCRNNNYPDSSKKVDRLPVPDEKVPWSVEWSNYHPPYFTSPGVLGKQWAEPEIGEAGFQVKVPENDTSDNSVVGYKYHIVEGYPINPVGRTGLRGRGLLGAWGPNHAADPIVTRWKKLENGEQVLDKGSGKPYLQFVSIQRRDCGEWAIPGGFVDPGEQPGQTLRREFVEEALDSFTGQETEKEEIVKQLDKLFSNGKPIYSGYVDDRRNTDNAWICTTAVLFHDTDQILDRIKLSAGDDAGKVMWKDISNELVLYASHKTFIKEVADTLNAHW
ncbi:ADP-ribose pyrophosphatase, mitochondrial [Nilaparvata lugens]|uniref:ADP-ribose pyrophosphatase, mitochondrial n=1 Tax=Nilaparvata lugens TaxID=108931 RepID=UPI00193DBC0F|nr:ADP-ribose pyrophosphatase, mitochondrial [Nilaparvata lugens]